MDNVIIKKELFSLAEPDYKVFMSSLLPSVPKEKIIGVRMPALRKIAKKIKRSGMAEDFLAALPHEYYEENALHAFIIADFEYDKCILEVKRFLPFIDNWGICDSLRPFCFSSNKASLLSEILILLESEHVYTLRFAIEMLMLHFLGEEFSPEMPNRLLSLRKGDYYLDMMVAWYFATALAYRYEEILPYLSERKLSEWIHNKTISKAIESRRISQDKKEELRALRLKLKGEK